MGGKKVKGSSKYSKKEVLELKTVFAEHDKDGSGSVSASELRTSLQKSGKGANLAEQADDMFKALDQDSDGLLRFDEYLKLYYPLASPQERQMMFSWAYPTVVEPPPPEKALTQEQRNEIMDIFVMYDEDKSGTLTRAELINALTESGYDEEEVEDMFEDYDEDGNNELTLEEFTKMLESSYLS